MIDYSFCQRENTLHINSSYNKIFLILIIDIFIFIEKLIVNFIRNE